MADEAKSEKPKFEVISSTEKDSGEAVSIPKPGAFNLDQFKSGGGGSSVASVETLQTALPHHSLSDANDFVRLHPNNEYWSDELCFVHVPIKGVKRDNLHLINKQIALRHLAVRTLKFFRLALASKPYDVFFLGHVPSQNLDNEWNATSLRACEQAKEFWTRATSRKADGVEGYKIDFARNPAAFPPPN